MQTRKHKQLSEKLQAEQKVRKSVGGIQIPRQVPMEKKPSQPKVEVEVKVVDKVSSKLNTIGTRTGRAPYHDSVDKLIEDLDRRTFDSEPSMPGFRSFSNSRRKKNSKAPYPQEF